MKPFSEVLPYREPWSFDLLARGDILGLFDEARRLKDAALAGDTGKPLRGKNLALLHQAEPADAPSELQRAATGLGARVAHVQLGEAHSPAERELRKLARLLGRLYDAIDCGTMAATLARQIEQGAGVPVYHGLDRDDHPARALADLMCMVEHGAGATPELVICFVGDPSTRRGNALLRAAAATGLALRVVAPSANELPPARSEAARFMVDARNSGHWVLHAPSGTIDDAECSDHHRLLLQTVLIATMARG